MEPKEVFEMEKTYIYKSSFATKIKTLWPNYNWSLKQAWEQSFSLDAKSLA